MSSTDPDARAAGRALLLRAADVARDLGCTYLGGVLYGSLGKAAGPVAPRGCPARPG